MIYRRLSAAVAGAITLAGLVVSPVHASTSVGVTAACSKPARVAALSGQMLADTPTIAEEQNVQGITTLRVDLSPAGTLLSENVFTSSGNPALDNEAMRSARLASFSPEVRDCSAAAGSYLYTVDFTK